MPIIDVFDPYTGGAEGGGTGGGAPVGGSWQVINTIDMTGLDVANITPPSAAGYSVNLTKGGAPFIDFYMDYSGTGLVYDVNAGPNGVRADWVSGTSNYLSQTIKLNDLLGLGLMNEALWRGRYALQMIVDNITYANINAERFGFYLSSDYVTMLGTGNSMGSTIMDNGTGVPATGCSIGLYNGTDVNEYLNQSQPTSACFTIVIWNGVITDQMMDVNVGYVTPYDAPDYGPMLVHRSPTQGIPYYVPYTDAYIGAVSRRKTNANIIGFRALKFE